MTAAYGNSHGYDGNPLRFAAGLCRNQTSRTTGGVAYTLVFDYENRLTEVKQGTSGTRDHH